MDDERNGAAVGALWQTVAVWAEWQENDGRAVQVECINENLWTRGVPKEERAAWVRQCFDEYSPETDPGGDIADAIGLGLWWLKERTLVPF